jgi:DNA gyrase subunit A
MEVGLVRRIDIDAEMQQSYLDYAMSVIVSRALPDARDGLKPVHRRILYAMDAMGIRPDSAFKKSARIVGEVLGKYHPHGDMAVYDAMARMAQDFSMRYPLVEGQGNFGSLDGDPPAAMRYTEARITELAMETLSDIDKDTVDFSDNFDGSLQEPIVLPAKIPNLLINGATGIAVGMSCSIPPHNLNEVCDALIYMLENWSKLEEISLDDLLDFIQGPDFPTGGIVLQDEKANRTAKHAYASGRSRITLQARVHVEEMTRGRSRIIVTELPYQTNKSNLIERIASQAREGRLEGVTDLRDESDRQGIRIVIELNKSADPQKIISRLYKYTPMQNTFSIILLALVDGEPRLMTLKSMLRAFIEHRLEIVRRRSEYDLEKAKARAHILEGLRVAIKNLDDVIQMIRSSKDVEQAQSRLERRLKLTETQAQAILNMPLRRLATLERKKIDIEYKDTTKRIKALEAMLASPAQMRTVISDELAAVKETYGDRRRTMIVSARAGGAKKRVLTAMDFAPDKETWIVITRGGRISRTPTARLPRLYGRASPDLVVGARGKDTLYLFAENGEAVALPVHTLPEVSDPKTGIPLPSGTPFTERVNVVAGLALSPDTLEKLGDAAFILFASAQAMVKKSPLSEFPGPSARPFTAVNINSGDSLGWVFATHGEQDVILINQSGYAIRFSEEDVRPMGLAAAGVIGMRLESKDDRIVGGGVTRARADLFVLTSEGEAKRTRLSEFPQQGRNGKGVLVWKSGEDVQPVGAAIGATSDRAVARLEKAADRSIRFGDAPRRARTGPGKELFAVKDDDRVTALRPVIDRPVFD